MARGFTQEEIAAAQEAVRATGVDPSQVNGVVDAAVELAVAGPMPLAFAAVEAAKVIIGHREQWLSHPVLAEQSTPRIQVLALPPERIHEAEANPFILVFDRVGGDTDLRRDLFAAREGLEIGTGARAVMIFGDDVEVVTGFEVDDALAAKIRSVLDRRTA